MSKNLVIVESPAKAKTIEGILGKDFLVKSSYGHVRDLVKEHNGVDIEAGFKPVYEVQPDKKAVIAELKKLSAKAEMVWLASDEDREGEAISWHLKEALSLPESKIKRIVFHEITQKAILHSVENPRRIDMNLVDAQQARRILDRLVGFEISPILWKKVKPSLSAGRVQSVAVRLIVDREREIQQFNSESYYKVVGEFATGTKGDATIKAELNKRFKTYEEAYAYLTQCLNASFAIQSLEKKPVKKSPAPPFTTSTLQQEASRKLRFNVARTMRLAQGLYEAGLISYMRTDSVNLSDFALDAAKNEVETYYGKSFSKTRKYKTKTSGAQEAHEAIRPTHFERHTITAQNDERALYELIWKRAIASQMEDAQIERTSLQISANGLKEHFNATGDVIKFEGFLKVYLEDTDDEEKEDSSDTVLPNVIEGQKLNYTDINAKEGFTRPPYRFAEASLIQKMEELGIGRPSTYSPTISTIQERGYVVKEDKEGELRNVKIIKIVQNQVTEKVISERFGSEKSKLVPSDIGILVNDFLVIHFPDIMDFQFTAKVESDFDEIAHGKLEYDQMLKNFYFKFHEEVVKTEESGERVNGERILGVHPETGFQVSVRMAKYGPVAQITDLSDEESKPTFANLRPGQRLESITFDETLALFELPRTLGEHNGEEVVVNVGRYGPYCKIGERNAKLTKGMDPYEVKLEDVLELFKLPRDLGVWENEMISIGVGRFGPYAKHNGKFFSLKKGMDPMEVTLEETIQLVIDGLQKEKEKTIASFEGEDIVVMKGRFGPYIKHNKAMFNLPKSLNLDTITLEECKAVIAASPDKAKKSKAKTTKAPKKTPAKAKTK